MAPNDPPPIAEPAAPRRLRGAIREAAILTNETCDHRCAFCHTRRPTERPEVAGAAAIRARIDRALAAGAETVILTGGEPTLRRDLPAIVAYASRRGARTVLETNAAGLGSPLGLEKITGLQAAGLDTARVHLPAWGPAADRITGDPGGFDRTRRAIAGLLAAGIRVEASLPISQVTLPHLAAIPGELAAAGLAVATLWLTPVIAVAGLGPPPVAATIAAIEAVHREARAHGLRAQLAPGVLLPPCLFSQPSKVAELYALSPGGRERPGYHRRPGCAACVAGDRCPGLPPEVVAAEPTLEVRPLAGDQLRRRLSVIAGVEAQIDRELVTEEVYRRADGVAERATTIRIQFRCNQACSFCFVSTHLPAAADARVEAAIVGAAADGGIVVLSGGEPTLHPRLIEFVGLARASGAATIELQTNAIRLGEGDLVGRLAAAGLDRAFVSLHGRHAATSDGITRAPGTFAKTLLGIDALHRSPIALQLNFVICRPNADELPEFVAWVAERWPRASICLSFVGPSTDLVPEDRRLIPRYSAILPPLTVALARAREVGVAIHGFDSMCGIPLCLVPAELAGFQALGEIPAGYDQGEFVHPAPCDGCTLATRCFGLRRRYYELYGAAELRPVG